MTTQQQDKTLAQDLSDKEIFPIVDPDGRVVGKATRRMCHSGSRLLHPVVHLHVFDPQGRIYLQQRSRHKFIQPSKWDTAVGGHVDYGETVEQALRREAGEELGLTQFSPRPLFNYVYDSQVERELVNAFYCTTTATSFNYDPVEVDDGRFWTIDEVKQAMGQGVLTPNFEQEIVRVLQVLHRQ